MASGDDMLTFVPTRKHAPLRGRMNLGWNVPLRPFTYGIPAKKNPPETPRPSSSTKETTELSHSGSDILLSPWSRSSPVNQKAPSRRSSTSSTRLDQPSPSSSHCQPGPSSSHDEHNNVALSSNSSASTVERVPLAHHPQPPTNLGTKKKPQPKKTAKQRAGPSSSHDEHNNVALNSNSSASMVEHVPLAHHPQPPTNLGTKKKPEPKKTAKRRAAKSTRATRVKTWEEKGTRIASRDVIDLDVILATLIETRDEISNELTSALQREMSEKYFDKIIKEIKETAAKTHKLQQLRRKKKALIKKVKNKSEQLLKLSIENLRHKHQQISPNDVHKLSQ